MDGEGAWRLRLLVSNRKGGPCTHARKMRCHVGVGRQLYPTSIKSDHDRVHAPYAYDSEPEPFVWSCMLLPRSLMHGARPNQMSLSL